MFLTSCNFENNWTFHPSGIYLVYVNNRNTRTRCKICSKLIKKTPKRYQMTLLWCLYYQACTFHLLILLNLNRLAESLKTNWEPGPVNTKLESRAGLVNTNWGPGLVVRVRAGGEAKDRWLRNTKTQSQVEVSFQLPIS